MPSKITGGSDEFHNIFETQKPTTIGKKEGDKKKAATEAIITEKFITIKSKALENLRDNNKKLGTNNASILLEKSKLEAHLGSNWIELNELTTKFENKYNETIGKIGALERRLFDYQQKPDSEKEKSIETEITQLQKEIEKNLRDFEVDKKNVSDTLKYTKPLKPIKNPEQ